MRFFIYGPALALAAWLPEPLELENHFESVGEPELVSSEALQDAISLSDLKKGAAAIYNAANASVPEFGHPTRLIGSAGHNATLEYIYDQLDSVGDYYDVSTQAFLANGGRVFNYSLVDDRDNEPVSAKPLRLTPATNGTIRAAVAVVEGDGCLGSQYKPAQGKIALVQRGHCAFGEKSEFAGLVGAQALLVWDPNADLDDLVSGDLGLPLGHQVASLAVTRRWAESVLAKSLGKTKLVSQDENGANEADEAENLESKVEVTLDVDAAVYQKVTVNVIAETKQGDHENVVMLGAHSDSVAAGPGINDNGSGTVSQLVVAKALAKFKVKNAVRFAWWSAEEEGLLGSLNYADNLPNEESRKIRLFMDYDMMASPNYVYEVYDSDDSVNPKGSSAIRDMYIDFYKSKGLNYTTQPFDGRSDYVGFLEIGIPAGGIDAGAEELKTDKQVAMFGGVAGEQYDQCYHEACDDLENVSYDAWLVNTQLIAHSVAGYARSLDGFPQRHVTVQEHKPHLRPNRYW